MADLTKIEWTDRTWNPTTGCSAASEGCRNCYAVRQTKRLEAMRQPKYQDLLNAHQTHFNGVVKCHEDALALPFKWKQPCRVFVNSMSDLFHPEVPFEFVDKVMAVIALNPHITFQVLTKRPERMADYFATEEVKCLIARAVMGTPSPFKTRSANTDFYYAQCEIGRYEGDLTPSNFCWNGEWPLPNLWLGTSVENQATANKRIPPLLRCPAAVRFLSCEPLLGAVLLAGGYEDERISDWDWTSDIHWVIAGGESGPNARPMRPDWARSFRDQCVAAEVPFFFKQWGEWMPETCVPPRPEVRSIRVGKVRAGRILDGREWNEFPEVSNG